MPIVSNTHITIPTQVSFVATPLPGTEALRVLPDAVAPTMSDAALGPDYKGNGGYVSPTAPAAMPAASTTLSTLIPTSFSTASATLSASAMVATQFLSQNSPAGDAFFAVYEELVAASQVKYKPSNATAPEPAPNNLFAKMLADTQTQNNTRVVVQAQLAPKEAATHAAPTTAPIPKLAPTVTRHKTSEASATAHTRHAAHVYQATSVRNKTVLEDVEAVDIVAD